MVRLNRLAKFGDLITIWVERIFRKYIGPLCKLGSVRSGLPRSTSHHWREAMSELKTRRELALLATGGLVASGLVAGYAKTAAAGPQPNMEHAKGALFEALKFLQVADSDKGGHREAATSLIQQAIGEIDAGIRYSDTH